MKTFATASAALVLLATAASADQSGINLNNGKLTMDITSQAAAGMSINGTRPGTVAGKVFATNKATMGGGVSMNMNANAIDTGNGISAGIGGSAAVNGGGTFTTTVTGKAFAQTNGNGARGDIMTFAGTYGAADIGFSGTFKHNMNDNDKDW